MMFFRLSFCEGKALKTRFEIFELGLPRQFFLYFFGILV